MGKTIKFPEIQRIKIEKAIGKGEVLHPNPDIHNAIVAKLVELKKKYTGKVITAEDATREIATLMIKVAELEYELKQLTNPES